MDKGKILDQTHSLYNENCIGCKEWRRSGSKQKHHKKAQEFCLEVCPIGKQLKRLGIILELGFPALKHQWFTKDKYEDLSRYFCNKEILKMAGIPERTFYKRLEAWELTKPKKITLTKEEYLRMSVHHPDKYIQIKCDISGQTLWKKKKEWGLTHRKRITHGANGEEITFMAYIKYKKAGLDDIEIRDTWEISQRALWCRKKEWKEQGLDPYKYSTRGKRDAVS